METNTKDSQNREVNKQQKKEKEESPEKNEKKWRQAIYQIESLK